MIQTALPSTRPAAHISAVLINGQRTDQVSSTDRGFLYGDGLFETIAIRQHQPLFLDLHLDRLAAGCQRLAIPPIPRKLLSDEATQLCRLNQNGVLKIQLTRGVGGRGYRVPEQPETTRVLSLHPQPGYPAELKISGVNVRVCTSRLAVNPTLAGIKHLNRLEQVLARQEWCETNIHEGIMLDRDQRVIEGTMSNLFLVKKGILITPSVERCGIAGIVRSLVIELAEQLKIACKITDIAIDALFSADELFLTNSIIGLWPIRQLDQQNFSVGPVTQQVAHAFERLEQQQAGVH